MEFQIACEENGNLISPDKYSLCNAYSSVVEANLINVGIKRGHFKAFTFLQEVKKFRSVTGSNEFKL